MNIARHWKNSNWRQLLRKLSLFWMKRDKGFLPALFFASLIGTYLDLYFVGVGLYTFPSRPMSSIFSINIAFTLIGLPIVTGVFLLVSGNKSYFFRVMLILFTSLTMAVFEKLAEAFGFFAHPSSWEHIYSFFGYMLFFIFVSIFHFWYGKRTEKRK